MRSIDYKDLYRISPPAAVILSSSCTSLSKAAWMYWRDSARVDQRARHDMVVSLLESYVIMLEFLFAMNPGVLVCLELPRGRFENEAVYAKLLALRGGVLRAVPYDHCATCGCTFQKSGILVTNVPKLEKNLKTCDGACPSIALMHAWTGRFVHADYVYYKHAIQAATYRPRFSQIIADAVLEACFPPDSE